MDPEICVSKKRVAVLASGRGSNFQAVIDAIAAGDIPAVCVGLITDNPRAYAIERAKAAGIPVTVVEYARFPSKAAYEEALLSAMKSCRADLFVLAGYMRILGAEIVHEFSGRMMNIHPALLPAFAGLHAQRQAIEYGVKIAGCTVHLVDEGMDTGPIVVQRCVPVLQDDDESTLAERILVEEHKALPLAVKLFCEDRLEVIGRRVRIR
ncbi:MULTISPECIES: phosphoribosylglycinamide formyltransferase [Methanoculleus]|jgi:phosphoribosylglycinamide formyltransferase-1|uniref:phosphoribosylglycinamide formyltransferase 1 n=1 Tax=Methanoculleus thermophilus TaxID=2200 RepID=A0A1G8XA73_9EURY|nr:MULTISPECIES: phosphoribosylglycinamide formyltransferase [Methanoculleus]NLN09429.1 phosphoribosylglycinamide formyltransferase [Methanoculleus thermophilus]SDJ87371.1 phosphoribosylglycinamide formyltransferase-1 [Methanoculleus thermophilus]HQD25115.1 phosphoribosylglycinamide formyltransferase [Methanoculleus thermophilus]